MSYLSVFLLLAGLLMLGKAAPASYSAHVQDSNKPTSVKDNFDNFADAISKLCRTRNRSNEPCEAPGEAPPGREDLYDNIAGVLINVIDWLKASRKPLASIQKTQFLSRPHLQNAAATPAPTPVGSLIRALADFLQVSRSLRKRPENF